MKYKKLLGVSNAKTSKGEDMGYLTGILYLAPSDMVSDVNVCKFASKGCRKACLFSAGRGKFNSVIDARIKKTEFFRDDKKSFFYSLEKEVNRVIRKANRDGLTPVIRLNGTSDIRYEYWKNESGLNIFELFPHVQFYDYTKDFKREKALSGQWSNYHLTFSVNESPANKKQAWKLLNKGVNVAMVFRNDLPELFNGYRVIDGDRHDLRFLDTKGVIVGLKAKGEAKKDQSGFVMDIIKKEKFLSSLDQLKGTLRNKILVGLIDA